MKTNMNRRAFFLTVGGLSLPMLLKAQSGNNVRAKNIINLYLPGGIAAQEWLDPKPLAPSEYRGPFSSVKTNVPGIEIGEMFPNLAKQADKYTIIRSTTHGEAAHERGTHSMITGYKPSPSLVYPAMGSVVSQELGIRNELPAYVAIPSMVQYGGPGYLSTRYSPFSLGSDPASTGFKVKDLDSPVEESRFSRRLNLLETIDSSFKNSIQSDDVNAVESFYKQANKLILSDEAKSAFDLSKEDQKMKDSYGMGQAGQRLLMARRLIESGVRLVTVTYGGWDMHDNIKQGFEKQAGELDKALSFLFEDLYQSGLLSETIVMVTSEFGRTPKINATNGRDHWPRVFSTLVAGGGFRGGEVYGESNSLGAEVEEHPVSPEDLSATVFHLAGIDHNKHLMTLDQRPIAISSGKIIKEII